MASEMTIQANYETGAQFDIETSSKRHIAINGEDHQTGDSPMEMLLVALAGCMGVSVISSVMMLRLSEEHENGFRPAVLAVPQPRRIRYLPFPPMHSVG